MKTPQERPFLLSPQPLFNFTIDNRKNTPKGNGFLENGETNFFGNWWSVLYFLKLTYSRVFRNMGNIGTCLSVISGPLLTSKH